MKHYIFGSIIAFLVFFGTSFCLTGCVSITNQTNKTGLFAESRPIIAQEDATLWLSSHEGKLYIYSSSMPRALRSYEYCLCRMNSDSLTIIGSLSLEGQTDHDLSRIAGQLDGKLYFYSTADDMQSLHMMELETGKTDKIWEGDQRIFRQNILADGNELWIRLFDCGMQGDYLLVKDGNAQVIPNTIKPYSLGTREYVLNYGMGVYPRLMYRENGEEWQDMGLNCGDDCSLIKTSCGLVIHNKGYSVHDEQILYLIQNNGAVTELLSFPCLYSQSALNVRGETLYFSIKRYAEYGEIGMKRFKNDALEGTYLINLKDLGVNKVSDKIFDGLYIFNESGIFASDAHCNVYKLNFDGDIIDTIMRVK